MRITFFFIVTIVHYFISCQPDYMHCPMNCQFEYMNSVLTIALFLSIFDKSLFYLIKILPEAVLKLKYLSCYNETGKKHFHLKLVN